MSGKLEAKITLSAIDKASAVLKKVSKQLDKVKAATAHVSASFQKFSAATAPLASKMRNIGFAAAGAAAGVLAIVKKTSDASWEIENNAKILGMSTEQYQKWSYALTSYTNVSEGGFKRVAMRLNDLAVQAAKDPTSDIAKGFRSMGIEVKNAEGKIRSFDSILMDFSEVFKNSSGDAAKTALLKQYLGRFGVELAPLLQNGKTQIGAEGYGIGLQDRLNEADYYGAVLSSEELAKLREASSSIWEIQKRMEKLYKTIAIAAAPAITKLSDKLGVYIAKNKDLIAQNVGNFFKFMESAIRGLITVFRTLKVVLSPVIKLMGGLENVVKFLAAGYIAKIALQIGLAAKAMGLLNIALWTNPYVLVSAGLIGAAILIYKYWDELRALFEKIGQTFEKYIAEPVSKFMGKSIFSDDRPDAQLAAQGITKGVIMGDFSLPSIFGKMQNGKQANTDSHPDRQIPGEGVAKGLMMSDLSLFKDTNEGKRVNMSEFLLPKVAANKPQKLDITMKIDAEGRPKDVQAKSKDPIYLRTNTGVLMPS